MIRSKLKSGFTLIELMVFFIFISILLAASTPIITKRVKNLPLKVYHGKYMCYRNEDGALVEEYYNASIRVSGPTVVADNACHFNPPKKATVYKIEMIGGGAGGYKYFGVPGNERIVEPEDRSGEYRIGYGMSYTDSKYHEVPDNAQLRRIFRNIPFRYVSANVGSGGRGSYVRLNYAPFGSDHEYQLKDEYKYLAKCTTEEKSTLTVEQQAECDALVQKEKDADKTISDMSTALYNAGKKYNFVLIDGNANAQAVDNVLDPYKTLYTSVATGYTDKSGASGGSGGYLTYNGLIDFMDYSKSPAVAISIDDVDSYLKGLPGHMTSGSLSATAVGAACPGWSTNSPENGVIGGGTCSCDGLSDCVTRSGCNSLRGYSDEDVSVQGDKGGDVERYGALQVWGRCVSNATRATGGEGAYATLNGTSFPQHIRYYDYYYGDLKKGDDAGGVVGSDSTGFGSGHSFSFSSSYQSSAWPSLIINTYLHKITHTVGLSGTSGKVKTVFESNLRDDCEFTIGKNGPVITDQATNAIIADEQSKLATTLSCNDHTINHRVDGGLYQKNTFSETKSEFDYMHKNSFTFTTLASSEGSASQYNPTNIFTKYNIGSHNFGQGGSGSGITDNCMRPQGYYKHTLKRMDGSIDYSRSESYDFEPFTCEMDNPAHFSKIDPTEGVGGAIIISW